MVFQDILYDGWRLGWAVMPQALADRVHLYYTHDRLQCVLPQIVFALAGRKICWQRWLLSTRSAATMSSDG